MKTLSILSIAAILMIAGAAYATEIPAGPVTGTWTAAGSPYYVEGDIYVPTDASLTIEHGVQVIFMGPFKFEVDTSGTLKAHGVEGDSVVFTAAWPAQGWRALQFFSAAPACSLAYCVIQYAKNTSSTGGGAIYCSHSSPGIMHCAIRLNTADANGGGIHLANSSNANISYNSISGNSATGGGGIFLNASSPTISNNIIAGNTAGYWSGGGIRSWNNSNPSITNNIIKNNSTGGYGGGIITESSHPYIAGNEISENHADYGGGLYCNGYISPPNQTLNKNTFYGNTATAQGGGIYLYNSSNINLKNCIFWANTAPTGTTAEKQIYVVLPSYVIPSYSDIQGGLPGQGNINAYPAFVDTAANNYHLLWGSPCIDTGDPNPIYNDPDGTRADMGCYYYDQGPGPHPQIVLSTHSLNFGEVLAGAQADRPLTIYNVGNATLKLYGISSSAPCFTTNYDPADSLIPAGDSLLVTVYFAPAEIAAYSGALTILNNDTTQTVGLQGVSVGPVSVTLTPENLPIIIPQTGGSFNFNITVENLTTTPQTFDFWAVIHLPQVGEVQVLIATNLALTGGGIADRDRTQVVPAFAPAGTYTYTGYVGTYSSWAVTDFDSFTFVKEGTDVGGSLGSASAWLNTGESWGDVQFAAEEIQPSALILHPCSPNPFNLTTKLTYTLPAAARVKLSIYDIRGCLVASLVDRDEVAGPHEAIWDAAGLPSGIYCARLETGSRSAVQKLVLMK